MPRLLVFLVACLVFFATPLAARALAPSTANALLPTSCPFEYDASEILVNVTINGRGPFTMKLDTGASVSLITPEVAQAAGIGTVAHSRTCGAYGGTVSLGSGVIGRLQMAGVSLYDQPCLIGDLNNALHCDGILAGALFDNYAVQIDFAKSVIKFYANNTYQPAAHDTCIPIDLEDNHVPVCEGEVDGIAARLEIDTGFDGSLALLPDFVRNNGLAQKCRQIKTVTAYSLEGVRDVGVYAMNRLMVGDTASGRSLDNIRALFDDFAGSSVNYDCDGLIGAQMLSHWTATFDYAHSRLVLH